MPFAVKFALHRLSESRPRSCGTRTVSVFFFLTYFPEEIPFGPFSEKVSLGL
jgi:hypothetical protein